MLSNNMRRCLSFVIALVMVFSLTPFHALGTEPETHDHDIETQTTAAPESTAASDTDASAESGALFENIPDSEEARVEITAELAPVQAVIDELLVRYLGATEITPEEITAKVEAMDWETYQTARWEISELEGSDDIQALTETQLYVLLMNNEVLTAFSDALEAKAAADNSVSMLTTVTVLDGKVSIADSANSNKESNGTVTIQAKGSLFGKKTNNITITNETDSNAKLSFEYTVSAANSFKIAGDTAATSGSYSVILEAGGTLSITLVSNSGLSNTTATLKLSNISLQTIVDSAQITFAIDTSLGSVTAGGSAVKNSDTINVTSAGVVLVATPVSGATFLGWINTVDNSVLSTAASYTLMPTAEMTVKAVFAKDGGTPWFGVGAASQKNEGVGLLGMSKLYYYEAGVSYLFDNLKNAVTYAADDSANKVVVLMNSGTLSEGTYTIPAGVTLLIPFDAANTLYTKEAQSDSSYTEPTPFRTLTLASGTNLEIKGSVSLSAKHRYTTASTSDSRSPNSPTGNVSFIKMEQGSSIVVENGGFLYCYGFITGLTKGNFTADNSGTITVKSGGNVYENFQIMDFRGGTQSTKMENGVFPLSQYYIQNIEVPLTLEFGAKEFAHTCVYMSSAKFHSSVGFIGPSGCMFNLTSGSVTKRYDGSKDRLIIDLDGNMTVSNLELSVGTTSIDSKKYDLPVNGNISINLNYGNITIEQDIVMLPGSEFNIAAGATITMGSGYNMYIYDSDQWGTFCGSVNKKIFPVKYAPGRTYTRAEKDLIDAKVVVNGTVDASVGYVYTTAGGANICSDGGGQIITTAGTQTVTHQLVQNTGYTEIPITPAKLKNDESKWGDTQWSFIQSGTNTYTYNLAEGRWECEDHNEDTLQYKAPTETSTGLTEGKQCSVCGTVTVHQEEIDKLISGVIYGTRVHAGDTLDIHFYIDSTLLTGSGYKIKVERNTDKDGNVVPQSVDWDYDHPDETIDKYRVFHYTGIAAKEMTDEVSITVVDANGYPVSITYAESIEKYALRALRANKGEEPLLCSALVDMLNYGAAAQMNFGYKTDDLANAELGEYTSYATQDVPAHANSTTGTDEAAKNGYHLVAASVTVESDLHFTFYFANVEQDMTAVATYTDHYGKTKKIEITDFSQFIVEQTKADLDEDGFDEDITCYGVKVTGLAVADGGTSINCILYDQYGNVVANITSNIESYLDATILRADSTTPRDVNLKNACESLLKFVASAKAYFDKT